VVKAREVCRLWLKIMNENRTLWRILNITENSLEMITSVVDQFDERSGSTLEEISTVVMLEDEEGHEDLGHLTETIQKSHQSLKAIRIDPGLLTFGDHPILNKAFTDSLLGLPNLVAFRAVGGFTKVRLSRLNQVQSRSIRVLWIPSLWSSPSTHLPTGHPDLFESLTSLQVWQANSHSTWRNVLLPSSRSLKHLKIKLFSRELGEDPLTLSFPNLEVMELYEESYRFPSWMEVPSSLKLFSTLCHKELPSVSELWVYHLGVLDSLPSSCPDLQVLRFQVRNEIHLS